ncbi:MAG: amphi-Trp domain-containing protein [Desulfomicrobiaceae bacterium]|nr:amphi-Trp domain-containing protein [Desulfomicrobiaceae bacterium]
MPKDKVSYRCMIPQEHLACLLESLAQGVRTGCVCLEGNDGRSLSLATGPVFDIEAKAKIKDSHAKLCLELEWTPSDRNFVRP